MLLFTKTNNYFNVTIRIFLNRIVTAQELRKSLGDESYTNQITNWINEIQKYFLNHEYKAVMEVVGPNGELIDHFDGRCLKPGHAIEGAWFILQEAKRRNKTLN